MCLEKFHSWNEIKKETHQRDRKVGYKEREVFWTRIGYNVGSEEYGKGNEFQRPVIIIKKLTKELFFGIPLSTVLKEGDYFYTFTYTTKKDEMKKVSAMLLQLRVFDKRRLMGRIGMIAKEDQRIILQKLQKLFSLPQEAGGARRRDV